MGTRSYTGFILDGKDFIQYAQYDGYPSGVGADFLAFIAAADLTELTTLLRGVTVVRPDGEPTAEQVAQLGGKYHQQVSSGTDWYAHLRTTQGNWPLVLESGFLAGLSGAEVREGAVSWVEYSYIVNLDAGTFVAIDGDLAGQAKMLANLDALPTRQELLAAFDDEE